MIEIISDLPVSSLRQRMIDEMNMSRFARKTQIDYVRHVERFAYYLGRPPDTATPEDLRQFQIDQQDAGVGLPKINSIVSALRFLFTRTLDRPDLARRLYFVKHPRSLPTVLSPDEVAHLLGATTSLKHPAALSVAYGAGLRVSEVAMFRVRDIDSESMLLRVERSKGGRYRKAILPADLLILLREWWKVGRPQGVMHADGWLFPALSQADQHASSLPDRRGGGTRCRDREEGRSAHPATQLCYPSVGGWREHPVIQALLGHEKLETTAFHTKVATRTARAVISPLDKLALLPAPQPQVSPDG